jgi:alginate O-acetyltransferase complex protein AlgJ
MVTSSTPKPENARDPAPKGSWTARAALALFLAWTFFPLAYRGFRPASGNEAPGPGEAIERPIKGGRPLADFLHDFSEYFEKSSPLRTWLIVKYTAFKLYTLGSPSVSSVVIGRNHWLFLGKETAEIDERRYFMGTHPFKKETLDQWLRVLTQRQRWLEQRGIAYWLVVAPNKSSIYPEFMPAIYPHGRSTRLDQLVEFMEQRAPGFPLLDLRPVLQAGKKTRLLYWPTDTHWNDFGRDIAYREIIRRLTYRFPSLKAVPENDFEIQPCQAKARDLEKMLVLPWKAPGGSLRLVPKRPLPFSRVQNPYSKRFKASVFYHSMANGVLPNALIIHDSFSEALKPILSVHFKRSRWIFDRSHAFPASWIDRVRPSLVIEEIAERYLEEDPWANPAALQR